MTTASPTQLPEQNVQPDVPSAPDTLRVPPERVPLAEVMRQIQHDALQDPAAYLEETQVPRGGE